MRFSLAVPHTPWIPAREESVRRVMPILATANTGALFTERAANWQWSRDLWRWSADQRLDYCVQLQDDVIPHPRFWDIVRAMCSTGREAYGLHAGHPAGPALAAQGGRWYRTRAWVVGVGYILRGDVMRDLADYRDAHEDEAKRYNEDDFIGRFLQARGIDVWHPMPSPIDHDTSVLSTYANDGHALRRPSVRWEDYDAEAMTRDEFWRCESAPLLASPYAAVCGHCGGEGVVAQASLPVCRLCLLKMMGQAIGLEVRNG